MASFVICSAEAPSVVQPIQRYEIDDRFSINSCLEQEVVDVWYPLIPDTPYQRVLNMAIEAPGPWSVGHERSHGNAILHVRLSGRALPSLSFRIRYATERRPVRHMLDPACVQRSCFSAGSARSSLSTSTKRPGGSLAR
jgi:hypothetical protein